MASEGDGIETHNDSIVHDLQCSVTPFSYPNLYPVNCTCSSGKQRLG